MRTTVRRIISSLVCIILLIGSVAGCRKIPEVPETLPITVNIATPAPDQFTEFLPEVTATPDPDVGSTFAALDLELFRWYVMEDGYSLSQMVTDPAVYGIDPSTVPMSWGEFSVESFAEGAAEAQAFLDRLLQIPRSRLNEDEQLSYDVLEQYLIDIIEDAEYEYYYEPLSPYTGLHVNLPLSLALFEIKTEQDVEDYLLLLEDTKRYLGQVLVYEQKRAELGLFMCESALDEVLSGCKSITNASGDFFLLGTFNTAIDNLKLPDAERVKAYKARNAELLKNNLIETYRVLSDGLEALRDKCSPMTGLHTRGEQALKYFEKRMQDESDSLLSVEEALELLQDQLDYATAKYLEAKSSYSSIPKLTSGNVEKDLEILKDLTSTLLPSLPAHTLTVTNVPKELQSMMSPAAYVIPSMDDWFENEVLINPSSNMSSLMVTLAHEAYPGHMYQYVYQRGKEQFGLMRKAIHFGGYVEGWSQLGENLFATNQTIYDKNYCLETHYDSVICNALLPAMVSIWVNCYGYSESSIALKLERNLGANAKHGAEVFYRLAIEMPYYYLRYALGVSQFMKLMQDAELDLGDQFNQKAYLTAYLDLGPGFYNLIGERMDVWVDNQILDMLG